MMHNLCCLSIKFLHPNSIKPDTAPFVAFTLSKHTWDLWHAHLGHLSGDLVKIIPSVATSVKLDAPPPQSHCKSCIVAKHPHRPFPLSSTPPPLDSLNWCTQTSVACFPQQHSMENITLLFFLMITHISSRFSCWRQGIKC